MALFGNLFGKKESGADALKNAAVGQEVEFGVFPQDKAGKKLSPVAWQVLDRKDGAVLLISKYALMCMKFNQAMPTWDGKIGWEKSSLRAWLNTAFADKCFSPEEKEKILETDVAADPNPNHDTDPGAATKDKVFLLSVLEAQKYFPDDASRNCLLTPFAVACGAWTAFATNDKGSARWWLRTPGYSQGRAACVECGGNILTGGNEIDDNTSCCIRPAIWVRV